MNKIYHKDCRNMKELPDKSVHLVVTSPPYNVGKAYEDRLILDEYLAYLNAVWKECFRVLCHGGRICINIAPTGKKPFLPLNAFITVEMLNRFFDARRYYLE